MNDSRQDQTPGDTYVDHFDNKSVEWGQLYERSEFKDRLKLFQRFAAKYFDGDGQVLDYGCGTGVLSRALADKGFRVHGVDASEGMIREANTASDARDDWQLSFEHIDPRTWSIESERVDAVVCSSVLEYVQDDTQLLRTLSSGLKSDGILLISVPNKMSLLGLLEDMHRRRSARHWVGRKRDVQFSWRRYSRTSITNKLSEAGFDIENVTYFEVPRLGRAGVMLSRLSAVGLMMLLVCRKRS